MKKLLSILLSIVMLVCAVAPSAVFAQDSKQVISSDSTVIKNSISQDIAGEISFLKLKDSLANYYDSFILSKAGAKVDQFIVDMNKCLTDNKGKLLIADKEDPVAYAAAICVINNIGMNPASYNGYDIKSSFQSLKDRTVSNPYYYRIITEACAVIGDSSLAGLYIDDMLAGYTMGKGYDYWGFACDNTAQFIAAVAPFSSSYSSYIEDALKVLSSYKTAKGYMYNPDYGTDANADSTALAIMAYSAVGEYDKAYDAYVMLTRNFESQKTNGVMMSANYSTGALEENAFATKDALIALPYLKADSISHSFVDGICSVCGASLTASNGETTKEQKEEPTPTVTDNSSSSVDPNQAKSSITSVKSTKGGQITVKVKKAKKIKGYQIQYSTSKNFASNKTKKTYIKNSKTTKKTIKNLKKNKKYYVRVRTYKIVNGKKVYSKWSKVKSVKTK